MPQHTSTRQTAKTAGAADGEVLPPDNDEEPAPGDATATPEADASDPAGAKSGAGDGSSAAGEDEAEPSADAEGEEGEQKGTASEGVVEAPSDAPEKPASETVPEAAPDTVQSGTTEGADTSSDTEAEAEAETSATDADPDATPPPNLEQSPRTPSPYAGLAGQAPRRRARGLLECHRPRRRARLRLSADADDDEQPEAHGVHAASGGGDHGGGRADQPAALKPRIVLAAVSGVLTAVVAILNMLDMGFNEYLGRGFNVILDWSLFADAQSYLKDTFGGAATTAITVGVILFVLLLIVLVSLATVRLANLLAAHKAKATRPGAR